MKAANNSSARSSRSATAVGRLLTWNATALATEAGERFAQGVEDAVPADQKNHVPPHLLPALDESTTPAVPRNVIPEGCIGSQNHSAAFVQLRQGVAHRAAPTPDGRNFAAMATIHCCLRRGKTQPHQGTEKIMPIFIAGDHFAAHQSAAFVVKVRIIRPDKAQRLPGTRDHVRSRREAVEIRKNGNAARRPACQGSTERLAADELRRQGVSAGTAENVSTPSLSIQLPTSSPGCGGGAS